jgi:CO/xanthine dehydrogenase Mo-binding subunit
LNILLAEDNIVNQRVASGLLVRRGHHVRIAADGEEALAMLAVEAFDGLTVDLPDPVRKYGNLTLTYAAQVHIGVIEIDPLTHNIAVLDYAAVDDCGRVMNHVVVKGQVIGAAGHGFGAAIPVQRSGCDDGALASECQGCRSGQEFLRGSA